MLNFPRHIATMDDVNNLKLSHPKELAEYLQDILNFKDTWVVVAKLDADEIGVEDATHKVVENVDINTQEVKERYQYELKEDPNGPIFRLGFATSQAVEDLIRVLREQAAQETTV